MWLLEAQRNLGSVLRYLASAVVAVVLVWTFDQGAFQRAFNSAWPDQKIPPMMPLGWVLLGLLILLGLFSYFLHRAIHRWITNIIVRRHPDAPPIRALDFARWIRREQSKTPARAVQDGLDLLNAATHFFYCSALAPIILGLILEFALSGGLVLSWRSVFPVLAVIGLFSCGYSLDLRAAEYDVAAWHEFPNARGGGRRPGEGA